MSYTPSNNFVFSATQYTPTNDFDFNQNAQGVLAGTLAGADGAFTAYQSPSSDLTQTLAGVGGEFEGCNVVNESILSAALDGVLGAFSAELSSNTKFSYSLDHLFGLIDGAIAPQADLKLPFILLQYTPSTNFTFDSAAYQPSTDFVFIGSVSEQITLDGISGALGCNYYDQRFSFNAVLNGIYGELNAKYIQNRAPFSATLDTISTEFSAANVPQGAFNALFDDLSSDFIGKVLQNRAIVNVQLSDISGVINSVNAPQAKLIAILNGVQGEIVAVNVPQAVISATLSIYGEFRGNIVDNQAIIYEELQGLSGSFNAEFDYNINRLTLFKTDSVNEEAHSLTIENKAVQNKTGSILINQCSAHQAATPGNTETCITTQATTKINISRCGTVDKATPLLIDTNAASDLLTLTPNDLCADNQQTASILASTHGISEQMTVRNADDFHSIIEDSSTSLKLERHIRIVDDPNPYTPGTYFEFLPDNQYIPDGNFVFDVNQGSIEFIKQYFVGIISTPICGSWQHATELDSKHCSTVEETSQPPPGISPWVDLPRDPIDPPPDHIQIIIPEKQVYKMQHVITATLLNGTPIHVNGIKIGIDADSFARTFSCTLQDKTQLPLIKQTGPEPVQLVITVNGSVFNVLVEKITRGRKFAINSIGMSGRGISALLGAPYQQATSASQGSTLTVQQIADLQLPLGWTINWQFDTWLVPGGAYTHTNATPIQAIKQIAENIGAVVVPHPTLQQLTIQPRYPHLPWDFSAAIPDVIIPDSVIPELTERPQLPEQANGVYVHGAEIGGQIGFCRLNGTAGDKLAQTESNPLMTDPTALRNKGARVLAGNAPQPLLESITLPMNGVDVPLLEIGQLIEVNYDGAPIRGIVNSVSLNASFAKVRQTIQLGEETTNKWVQFNNLLPADPLLFATLSSTDGSTSLMAMLDGGVVRVRGTGTANNNYYIRSGKIDSIAPSMAQSEIVI